MRSCRFSRFATTDLPSIYCGATGQGFEFLHRNMVAHRDVGPENILSIWPTVDWRHLTSTRGRHCPVFPVRYYIIDFEFSIEFSEDSTPDQRVVNWPSRPTTWLRPPDDHGRDIAPEMLLNAPHCPFKLDVFQLGKMFLFHFHVGAVGTLSRAASCCIACREGWDCYSKTRPNLTRTMPNTTKQDLQPPLSASP